MKKLLLLSLLIPALSQAQSRDTSFAQINEKFNKASSELTKFDTQFKAGALMEIAGGVLVIVGSGQDIKEISVAGGIVALAGFIMSVSSSDHIKKAGFILRGSSLIVPIYKKKPGRLF